MTNRDHAGWIAVLAAFAVLLAGCEHKQLDYPYSVGIEDYSYTGDDGSSLPGPLGYLSGLDVADRFTVTAEKESEADAQARSRFEVEMNKIDPAALETSAAGGTYRFRYVLRPEGCAEVLAERTYANR